jgi:predicted aspartyl protease
MSKGSAFMPTRLAGLLLLILLARCGAEPEINCDLTKVAEMPLQVQDRLLVVPVGINGKWAHLVADTGAERTMLTGAAAQRLGLPLDSKMNNRQANGIGGSTSTADVPIDRLVLGGVHFPVNQIAVSSFKLQLRQGFVPDGLLGSDILLAFDMDIDVPGGNLTLYRSRVCPNARPPWPFPAAEIIGVRIRKDRLLLPFELDNVAGLGVLDTGAQGNVLGVDMARRMGLDEQAMANDRVVHQHGVGPGETQSRLHHFQLLRIGPVVEVQPAITVLPSDFGVGDALIGETFLQGRRVWMSFRNRQVFVSKRPGEL